MLAREFMHKPAVTCDPAATLRDVARAMELRNVGCVVVLDGGAVLGIVTDRDLAVKGVARDHLPSTPVSEIMTKVVVSVDADTDVFDVARKMSYAGVRRLPVVDPAGTVLGVVALDDITDALTKEIGFLRETVHTQLTGGPGWDTFLP